MMRQLYFILEIIKVGRS